MKKANLILLLFMCINIYAQDNIILRYDFSKVSGKNVTDLSTNSITAKLSGSATVQAMGKYNVLNLGTNSGYLDMTSNAGEIIKSLTDFSVSCYYKVDENASLSGNGYFLWSFSDNAACAANSGKYNAYRLNAQRIAT
nr:hypothetical protein [Bacteroidaceae bacterium]